MASRKKSRDAQALEALYHSDEDQESEESDLSDIEASDNDPECASSHASETEEEYEYGEPPLVRVINWSKKPSNVPNRKPQNDYLPSANNNAANARTPAQAWSCLMSNDLLEIVLKHTNEKIDRKIKALRAKKRKINPAVHSRVDLDELKACIGLLYYAGAHGISSTKSQDWWGTHGLSLFKAVMTHERFTFLMDCWSFDDRDSREERKKTDRLAPIREVWDIFAKNCSDNYQPHRNCTIGEQILSFKGRCPFKVKVGDKCGLRILSLNDSDTNYMINAVPYTRDVVTNKPLPTYYAIKLTEPIHKTGRSVTCNNWFTNYFMVKEMKDTYKIFVVGTLKKSDPDVPREFKLASGNELKAEYGYSKGITMVSYNTRENKIVILLSSLHNEETTGENWKPEILNFYDKTKGSVDAFYEKCQRYSATRKTKSWVMRLFYGMLDQAGVNSFILYNLNKANEIKRRKPFIMDLSLELAKQHMITRNMSHTLRLNLRYLIESFVEPSELREGNDIHDEIPENRMGGYKKCNFCPPEQNRTSQFRCLKCIKPMCRYHTGKVCVECSEPLLDLENSYHSEDDF